MNTGLRAGELVGLRWKNVHFDTITIDEAYTGGEWGSPKSEASNATIAVNRSVIERIQRLKKLTVDVRAGKGAVRHYRAVKSDGPEDLVFQLLSKNAPQCANNVLFKHIKPAARALRIPWVNWQVLRRSHATWLKMAGADVKDAQAHASQPSVHDTRHPHLPTICTGVTAAGGRFTVPTAHQSGHFSERNWNILEHDSGFLGIWRFASD